MRLQIPAAELQIGAAHRARQHAQAQLLPGASLGSASSWKPSGVGFDPGRSSTMAFMASGDCEPVQPAIKRRNSPRMPKPSLR